VTAAARQPRPWRVSLTECDGLEHDITDLVNRDFTAAAPGQEMAGDITLYFYLGELAFPRDGHRLPHERSDRLGRRR
jgi:hypothetical protein